MRESGIEKPSNQTVRNKRLLSLENKRAHKGDIKKTWKKAKGYLNCDRVKKQCKLSAVKKRHRELSKML